VRLQLQEGSTELRVAPTPSAKRSFEVTTPAVNLGVRGTDFRARVDASGRQSWLEVLEGRVVAQAGKNAALVSGGQGLVAQENQPLKPPAALLPAPQLSPTNARIERVPLRLNWQPTPGAQSYRAQVFAPDQPDSLLLDGRFAQPVAKWADLPDGRYTLRVRALGESDLEGRNAEQSFVLKARPEPPFTTAPPQAGNVYGEAAHLAWASAGAAEQYRVQVARADDRDFKSSVLDVQDIKPSQYAAKLEPGSYRWRVASVAKDQDQGPFGDALTFTLKPMPSSPQMSQPEASKEAIVLRWSAPQAGQKVRYQISKRADFSKLLVDAVTEEAQGQLKKPGAGTHYIRAKTIDADGFEGHFGAVQQVSIERSTWWMLLPAVAAMLVL
jgi:hypothetical protein